MRFTASILSGLWDSFRDGYFKSELIHFYLIMSISRSWINRNENRGQTLELHNG
ncbi:hypothetical protein ALT721_940004 [Alteromonas alvinellae]